MVFQSYAVWPHMTVRQNVAYPLKHRSIGARRGRRARSTRCWSWSACRNMPSGRWWRCRAGRCSASRWRAASSTGRNCCCSTSRCRNLDAKLRLRLRDDLRRILKATGMTALYVTHDQAEAVVLGDRIGVMRDGKLLQMGTPDEIYNRPADLFVANFTGATNELAGHLGRAQRRLRRGRSRRRRPRRGRRCCTALGAGDKVRIALRPENIATRRKRRRQRFSRARARPPLPGHADGLRHRTGRPPPGSARARHRGAPRYRHATPRSRCRAKRSGSIAIRVPCRKRSGLAKPVPDGGRLAAHQGRSQGRSQDLPKSVGPPTILPVRDEKLADKPGKPGDSGRKIMRF